MKNLFRFIIKFHRTILFLFLELICFLLVVNNNYYQKAVFFNSSNKICGSLYESYNNITSFVSLKQENEKLIAENTRLKNSIKPETKDSITISNLTDTSKHYYYRYAKVVNNSINRQHNSITINKGSKDGIKPEMAVVSAEGVVGITRKVNRHYSTVLPILNTELSISAKIKKNGYWGSLCWDGKDYRKAILKEIPYHTEINKGDTIITSGLSSIFPEGIIIATIEDYAHSSGESFLDITVRLNVDFKKLNYVYIIENNLKKEQTEIESNKSND